MNGNGTRPDSFCARQDDRIDRLEQRADDQDDTNATVLVTLARIEAKLGHAPDPVNGDPGSGQMRILHNLANALLTGRPRSPLESIHDGEFPPRESEVSEADVLRAQLAAANATIAVTEAERKRNSLRVVQRWTRAQKIIASVIALIAAMGGGATLLRLLGY